MPGTSRDLSASTEAMRAFWDERARKNALWFIKSDLDFRHPDAAEFWRSGERDLQVTLELFDLKLDGSERVIEIGCGIGRITRALAQRAREVVGVDVSEEMVRRARANLKGVSNASVELCSGRDLSRYGDRSFDAAYSFLVFQHIPDPDVIAAYIREMGRVLRGGGWALFQLSEEPAVHSAARWAGENTLRGRIATRLNRRPDGCTEAQWLGSSLSRAQLLDAIDRGNLQLEGSTGDGTQYCFVLARAL